ncbi:hypothetical protein LCGC14_1028930 [marine sediment metagenome]|uniref:MrpA C-terminal/MbhD domain-containing protein n=1 Tax=marine sediment metagenome TaxID=412755 RepID=A0A0F9MZP4_9ZZZZ
MQSVISFIIFSIVLAYILLVVALITKDYILGMISGMAIMIIGVYIAIYNVESINTLLTQGLAVISICLGFFVFINASKEVIEESI